MPILLLAVFNFGVLPGIRIEGQVNAVPCVLKTGNTLKVGKPNTTGWIKTDTNASIDKDTSGNIWMILGGGGWEIYKGTGMDNMVPQYKVSGQSFAKPHNDEIYWPSGLWIDPFDGKWYLALHVEYNYGLYTTGTQAGKWSPDHRRRMALATSDDEGRSWTLVGDILTGDNPDDPGFYSGDYYDKGPGDAQIFIGNDYFYAYYREGWYNKSTNRFYEAVRVARCARGDKMAPGKWHKWYNGTWNEPGLGGHDTDVFNPGGGDTGYVFFSTFLMKYVALIGAADYDNPRGYISTCTDLNIQDWSDPIFFCDYNIHKCYNWAVDKTTWSRHIIGGDSFRYYTSCNDEPQWFEASFEKSSSTPVIMAPLYPPESMNDFTPGWDRSYTQ
jgi:hypothetical protein